MISLRMVMANYRYSIDTNINLYKTAKALSRFDGWIITFDHNVSDHIYCIHKSNIEPTRKTIRPIHKLKIRADGRMIHYGPDLDEIEALYTNLMAWFKRMEPSIV